MPDKIKYPKKLIEVSLPLEKINDESAREKSIRHGHPSTLHLWWARRPLAAARAVIWASLVDDPSSHPEKFPTEEEQNEERQRLFRILEELVVWENSNNSEVLDRAKAEIKNSLGDDIPELLDPFAGGGAIPLEAQRLGLKAHAHDLNPVAVMINKAMIEIPPRFSGNAPVNPDALFDRKAGKAWSRAEGLAKDVRYYGGRMKREAFKRIGHLYPKAEVPRDLGGGEATVIAWIWARTVKCPNPACGCEMPLANSFILSKKKGNEAWVEPVIDGTSIEYVVHKGKCPKGKESCKLARGAEFKCVRCGAVTNKTYIHDEISEKRSGSVLMAVVAEGKNGRIYLSPSEIQSEAARSAVPEWEPNEMMNVNSPNLVSGRGYGITQWKELFTNRQLTALTTFCDLVKEAQGKAESDAIAAGMADDGIPLRDGGKGAKAYGEAIGVYLAFLVDKLSDYQSAISSWDSSRDGLGHAFGRQAIPMVWDYSEGNPFSNSSGCFDNMIAWVVKSVENFPFARNTSLAEQLDAQSDCGLRNIMVSTDPPYYDNICYADLSDYFYIWMRHSLKDTYPELFSTVLVPKVDELVAEASRHEGDKTKAKKFFEDGMLESCKQIYKYTRDDIPVTIYYAYKQSDSNEKGTASTGWETMLSAIIKSGFTITGTWPMRTELTNRRVGISTNALASSIVLVCRKRPTDAPITTRRNFVNALRRELRPALKKLQESNIAPVDLAQSAIGPGMAVFSRYGGVLGASGEPISVREALLIINEEIDLYFNEQSGDMDNDSRFCLDLYTQYAYNNVKYGEAEVLSNAKMASIRNMSEKGILYAKAGIVHLKERSELPEYKPDGECLWLLTQQLTRAVSEGGNRACAEILMKISDGSDAERAKDLAYRLYTIAERKGWASEAYAYNSLVVSWQEILKLAEDLEKRKPEKQEKF